MNWEDKLDDFGRNVLAFLGENPYDLPTEYNPITRALKENPNLIEELGIELWFQKGKCRLAFSKVATICQMKVYDAANGPEGDSKRKGLRRQWYAWYKTDFAQSLSNQLEESEFNGTLWAGRMSQTYGWFVDNSGVTYRDLWVDDASRMLQSWYEVLFRGCNIVLAVEKDSLFADFKAAASALGAKSLVSGKGKQSKAATEKVLREHFGWSEHYNPFTSEDPLIVLHISDHDFDGESVIGPTFGFQPKRYTPHVLEARVGIKPKSINKDQWRDKWYSVKTTNDGYIKWSEKKALFLAECTNCSHKWPTQNNLAACPECSQQSVLTIKIGKEIVNQPYGFEVEAMPTRFYYRLIVTALLEVLPFEYIIKKLREECIADIYQTADTVCNAICENNADYQKILKEFERLEVIKLQFEDKVKNQVAEWGSPHISDWREDDDDPAPEQYANYVEQAGEYSGPWRPFDKADRTGKLIKFLKIEYAQNIKEFEQETIEF